MSSTPTASQQSQSSTSSQNKRQSSTTTNATPPKRSRGPTYTDTEMEAILNLVVQKRTFDIKEFMVTKGFSVRSGDDYKRTVKRKFSDWRSDLQKATDNIKKGNKVALMINNKTVALGGMDKEEGENRIGEVLFTNDYDCVWFVLNGKPSTCLPKPMGDVVTCGDAMGNEGEGTLVAWPHDQIRAYVEDSNTLSKAFVQLLKDENILAYTSTSMSNEEDEIAQGIIENQSQMTANERYQSSITRNNTVAKEQALSYVSYASNQLQMLNVTKEYASLLKMCKNALMKLTDIEYQEEKKVYLQCDHITRYAKVKNYNDLENLASGMKGVDTVELSYEKNGDVVGY